MTFAAGHALVIGVGSYQYIPHWNVPITVADANAVAEVLGDPLRAGYPAAQVKLLTNAAATRDAVLGELARLAGELAEQDTLLVFYCGHGAFSADGAYQLSTHDTRLAGTTIVAGSAVSQHELIGGLRGIKARRVLLLLNACHVGAVAPALGEQDTAGRPVPASLSSALLSTGTGRIIITACKEEQLSYIGKGPLTRFSGALVDGLSGRGDVTSRNGFISAFDLYLHVFYTVHDQAAHSGQQQEPELTVLKGVGPFAVSLYRGAGALGSFDESEQAPAVGAVREVQPERSRAAYSNIAGNQVAAGRDAAGGDLVQGDQIRVGNIVGGTGIAIGRNASVALTGNSIGNAGVDPEALRAALEGLWQALSAAGLTVSQQRVAQTAAGVAIDAVADQEVDAGSVAAQVKKIGATLADANTVIEQGSSLWNSVQQLAPLLGPLVGGARVVAAWFGVPL